jgi:hypothetical protein
MNNCNIYQIYYQKCQLQQLDPAFTPYDNTSNEKPDWREYHVFEKEFDKNQLFKDSTLAGFFSWKFNQKSHISGQKFIDFISNNPGYDLYIINPFPLLAYQHNNIWEQGEKHHPGLIELVKIIFEKAEFKHLKLFGTHPLNTFSFCNYWVGNEKFWIEFIKTGKVIKKVIESELPLSLKKQLQSRADKKIDSNYIPFIYERIITSIISDPKSTFSYISYQYDNNELRSIKRDESTVFCRLPWNYNKKLSPIRRLQFLFKQYVLNRIKTKK